MTSAGGLSLSHARADAAAVGRHAKAAERGRPRIASVTPADPLRIGIVNLMPVAEEYEHWLLPPMLAGLGRIEPVWIRVRDRRYALDDRSRIDRLYRTFASAQAPGPLDGLIVTGAAVEHLPYADVRFMPELEEMVTACAATGTSILGMCWGAFAVAHLLLGVPKREYRQKVFGVFETDRLADDEHVIAGCLDDRFWSAHSRYAGFDEDAVDAHAIAGDLRILARSDAAGSVILEAPDHGAVMHTGHPEYGSSRLVDEYRRDVAQHLEGVRPPANVDLNRPVNQWRSHARAFFSGWLRSVDDHRRTG